MKQQPVKGRRAILVVTDNEGLNYKSPDEAVVRAMYSAETVLSALVVRKGARPPAVRRTGYTNPDFDPPDVYKISERTGGEAVEGLGKVNEMFQKMIERARSRYFLQYPAPQAEPGSFRRVRVELSPAASANIPTRRFAPAPATTRLLEGLHYIYDGRGSRARTRVGVHASGRYAQDYRRGHP